MASLSDFFGGDDFGAEPELREIRIGDDAVPVLLFTEDMASVKMHYVDDESVKSYVVCPSEACPICFVGTAPKDFMLVPVFAVDDGEVRVLRISTVRGPGALGPALRAVLRDPHLDTKVVMISRHNYRYSVNVRPLSDTADRGESTIGRFSAAVDKGLGLESAFHHMSAEELATVPKVARRLATIGGYKPATPRSDTAGLSDVAD